ncbi:hypothetical protein O3P69_020214 [Scylla paramamosain]|uniref:Uncharacterized protein n=1 Tax=Scylla paramamosain TaxID=85552 RepID=A0AAW0TLD3_SCYPA
MKLFSIPEPSGVTAAPGHEVAKLNYWLRVKFTKCGFPGAFDHHHSRCCQGGGTSNDGNMVILPLPISIPACASYPSIPSHPLSWQWVWGRCG